MSLSNEQSIQQGSVTVTQDRDELQVEITGGSFKISECINPNDRSYEMRHFKASFLRWQHNGSILLVAHSVNLAPNEGYLDIKSTGYTQMVSDHNIMISAKGHKMTGGGDKATDQNKSLELYGKGDVHIQSDGKGGVYISAAENIELKAGGSIILNAADQVSINTGSKDPVSVGESQGIGSGKFVVSTAKYELACTSYNETVTGRKQVTNTGELTQEQKLSTTQPTLPSKHITHTETVGSLVHKIDHDYVLEVGGKMLLKVNNDPSKIGGVLGGGGTYGTQQEALVQEIGGGRLTTIRKPLNPPFGDDVVRITEGYAVYDVIKGRNNLAFRVNSQSLGDIVLEVMAKGQIGIANNTDPITIQSRAGDIRIDAQAKMVDIKGTKEVRIFGAKINLN